MGEKSLLLKSTYKVNVWVEKTQKLYGDDSCPSKLAENLGIESEGQSLDGKLKACRCKVLYVFTCVWV